MYIETSYPRRNGDKATLISPDIISCLPSCLSFKAHMYGKDINRLRIDMVLGGSRTMLLETIGNQGNKWHSYDVDLPRGGPYKVASFEIYPCGLHCYSFRLLTSSFSIGDPSQQFVADPHILSHN